MSIGRTIGAALVFLWIIFACSFSGCSAPPEVIGYPVSTPHYYSEDKMFFLEPLRPLSASTKDSNTIPKLSNDTATRGIGRTKGNLVSGIHNERVGLQHVYEVNPEDHMVIENRNPITVILQGVRLPEDMPGGTRDIAVVLDIVTNSEKSLEPLVAFYQRDVPPGQMLNFSNIVVYSDPAWDSASAPYFRVRVLDVKAERNKRTATMLHAVSNLAGEISGLIPHPIMPIVTRAIDAAGLVLSNQRNEMLLDFQVQLYGAQAADNAGDAKLGRLFTGQFLILGRRQGKGAEFWSSKLALNRQTDQIVDKDTGTNIPVPYVSIAISKSDLQVPKLVMDRSASLVKLISTQDGKSDVDALDSAADVLGSAIHAYTAERRLSKFHSNLDMEDIIQMLDRQNTAETDKKTAGPLTRTEVRRLIELINKATGKTFTNIAGILQWWSGGAKDGYFEEKKDAPLGVIWKVP